MIYIDHILTAWSRVTSQYKTSTKFYLWICELMSYHDEQEAVYKGIAEMVDIDIAYGAWLDLIGNIVGVSRIIPDSIALKFFGFEGQENSDTFGEENDLSIGSRFREENESYTATSVLEDPEFRLLIRAKITKNHSTGTQEDVLEGLSYLFNTDRIVVTNLGRMAFSIAIGRRLTFQEQIIINNLDILARPAGVDIKTKIYFDGNRYFGFEDQPGALGFGEENDLSIGGIFAEEF